MPKLLLGYFKTYLLWCIGLIALIVAQGCVQLFGLTQEMKRIVDQGIQTGDMNYIICSGMRHRHCVAGRTDFLRDPEGPDA